MSEPTYPRLARGAIVTTRRIVVTLAVLVCVVGLGSVFAASVAKQAGYQVLGMKTGSMHPAIDPGDLVVAEQVQPTDIRNDDVITFRAPTGDHAPYTHRVVRTLYDADGPQFITQGDSNAKPDLWTVRYAAEGWRVIHVQRSAGRLLAFQESVIGRRLVAASVFIVAIALLWPVFSGPRRAAEPARTHGASTAAPRPEEVTA